MSSQFARITQYKRGIVALLLNETLSLFLSPDYTKLRSKSRHQRDMAVNHQYWQ